MNHKIAKHFREKDPILFAVLEKIYPDSGDDFFVLNKKEDLFLELVESITSQQLSVKASDTIFKRLIDLMPKKNLNPKNVLKLSDDKLRSAGLSFQKIKYVKDLSQKVLDKEIILENLDKLSDEEVIMELTKVKGIGRWTAEMFLMFALARPDLYSHGDLGLQNAFKKLYQKDSYKIEEVEEIIAFWSPYKTFACRILWHSLKLS